MCVGGGGGRERGEGVVYSLANCSVAYEEAQSNRASDFRDFVCFQRQSFFTFLTASSDILHTICERTAKAMLIQTAFASGMRRQI